MKGWYIPARPDEVPGDSTAWYASFWDFCADYLADRFGNDWCLSPEQSLSLQLANKRLQRWKRHMGTIAKQFEGIRQRIGRGQLHGKDKIGVRVGRVLNKYKVGKHFKLDIRDDSFSFEIDDTKVTAEAALDGIYVIRTSLAEQRMKTDDTVRSYKLLTQVERAFRSFKSMDLKVRPIRHRRENRVRARLLVHAGLLRPVAHDGGLAAAAIL